ncbi:MAG: metallophosphoesterase [Proteobacteria bacterium]|nr:metallophosphoesterase [Pseudomonadota bacterium]
MRSGQIHDTDDPVRVLHLTDPHLFGHTAGVLRGIVTHASLSSVIEHYRAGGWRAHVAVLTGDVIQDDAKAAYAECRKLFAQLELPIYCVPGNHDIRSLMREALAEPPFHYCASTVSGNWLIVGIDSCAEGRASGYVTDDEQSRLSAVIAASQAQHVMVCLHHPPISMGSAWLDAVGLDNGEEFLARLRSTGKVRLAVFGHVHQPYDELHDGVHIICTPSTCRQFMQGSDEFAVDDHPPAYRRISLHADGRVQTELVWVQHD